MDKKTINLAPIPSELDSNPYISILHTELIALGVNIVKCPKLTFRWLIKNAKSVDILHFHWPETHYIFNSYIFSLLKFTYFFALILFAKSRGIKVVWTSHNILEHEKRHSKLDMLGKKLMARFADAIIAHCEYAAGSVRLLFGREDGIHYIPHPNYISYYRNDSTREESRKKLDLPDDKLVYLLFGAVRKYKGVLDLIDTFNILGGARYLVIAGKARDESLKKEIAEKVRTSKGIKTFFKFVDDDDIQYYFNAADFVILPYKDIVTSGALILAMSFKKPVIAPDIGCFTEILDESTGILYDPEKINALSTAITNSAALDASTMGENAFNKVKLFDPKEVAAQHIEIYNSLMD